MIEDADAVERVSQQLRAVITPLAQRAVAPPILQPAAVYLELVGEEIRRSAVLTQNEALCLRPDMTIPAARLALSIGEWSGQGFSYAYDGRVFRVDQAGGAPSEARHAGVEWYAPRGASGEIDARCLRAALQGAAAAGVAPRLVLGCAALRERLIAAAGLPQALARRVRRRGLEALRGEPPTPEGLSGDVAAFADALLPLPPERASEALAGVLRQAGIALVGGRTAGEIAARLQEKAAARSARPDPEAGRRLEAALMVEDEPERAFAALQAIAGGFGQPAPILERIEALAQIWRSVADAAPAASVLCVGFKPAFEYYDGLLFSLRSPRTGAWLGGGGRYDRVLRALQQAEGAPPRAVDLQSWGAAGFSLAPAALAAEAQA
jgi:ATP phosphoribosyltransferase regulatory subunit